MSQKIEWHKKRLALLTYVLRYPHLSARAKVVWSDLAFNWAWGDPTCYPNQDLIAKAMGVSRSTVTRCITELKKIGLVSTTRGENGNCYNLVEDPPPVLRAGSLIDNRAISRSLRKKKKKKKRKSNNSGTTGPPPMRQKRRKGSQDDVSTNGSKMSSDDASKMTQGVKNHASKMTQGMRQKRRMDDEAVQKKLVQERKEKLSKEKLLRDPQEGGHALGENFEKKETSRSALGIEGSTANEENRTYDVDDTQVKNREGVSRELLSVAAESSSAGTPSRLKTAKARGFYSDSPQTSSEPRGETPEVLLADRPIKPPETPSDVLRLLRDEILEKYGEKNASGVPSALSGKQAGQIKSVLLRKYSPRTVLSMIRLLVWDWEVARQECFPKRFEMRIPDVDSLVQYATTLASNIGNGFMYGMHQRGTINTYRRLYVRKLPWVYDPDPP
jgi:hypothetical protein